MIQARIVQDDEDHKLVLDGRNEYTLDSGDPLVEANRMVVALGLQLDYAWFDSVTPGEYYGHVVPIDARTSVQD